MHLRIPVFFHPHQQLHEPGSEYASGTVIAHHDHSARAESILEALHEQPEIFEVSAPERWPMEAIEAVHDRRLIEVIRAASGLPPGAVHFPCVFPYSADKSRLDTGNLRHAGAFCFDTATPLQAQTFTAAAWSAACAWHAADVVSTGRAGVSYALCRPPGHHASRDLFGGYCYFNNAAVAAHRLMREHKRIAIIDIDFHHGNGTQAIFEESPDVFFCSLHADPGGHYPYYSGFASERGRGEGEGFTLNIPLPSGTDGSAWLAALQKHALPAVQAFAPGAIVVSAGFDTFDGDPIGTFRLTAGDYITVGQSLAAFSLPMVVVQEGGYAVPRLGENVRSFLQGLATKR